MADTFDEIQVLVRRVDRDIEVPCSYFFRNIVDVTLGVLQVYFIPTINLKDGWLNDLPAAMHFVHDVQQARRLIAVEANGLVVTPSDDLAHSMVPIPLESEEGIRARMQHEFSGTVIEMHAAARIQSYAIYVRSAEFDAYVSELKRVENLDFRKRYSFSRIKKLKVGRFMEGAISRCDLPEIYREWALFMLCDK